MELAKAVIQVQLTHCDLSTTCVSCTHHPACLVQLPFATSSTVYLILHQTHQIAYSCVMEMKDKYQVLKEIAIKKEEMVTNASLLNSPRSPGSSAEKQDTDEVWSDMQEDELTFKSEDTDIELGSESSAHENSQSGPGKGEHPSFARKLQSQHTHTTQLPEYRGLPLFL